MSRSAEVQEKVLKDIRGTSSKSKLSGIREIMDQGGISKVRVEPATGEYIMHCDSSDWEEPYMYEQLYKKANVKNAVIVGCDCINEYQKMRCRSTTVFA